MVIFLFSILLRQKRGECFGKMWVDLGLFNDLARFLPSSLLTLLCLTSVFLSTKNKVILTMSQWHFNDLCHLLFVCSQFEVEDAMLMFDKQTNRHRGKWSAFVDTLFRWSPPPPMAILFQSQRYRFLVSSLGRMIKCVATRVKKKIVKSNDRD